MRGSGVSALALVLSLLALVFGLSGIVIPESQMLYYVHGTTDTSTSSAIYVDLAEMSINIDVVEGQELKVFFTGSFSCSPPYGVNRIYCVVRIVRNDTHVVGMMFALQDLAYPSIGLIGISIHAVDSPSTGTYTYKAQWKTASGGYSIANLVATQPENWHRTLSIEVF